MSHTPEPERTLRSGSVRNPRRRPRESNPDSVKSAPRRKRSKIDRDTFVPPRTDDEEMESVNGSIEVAQRGASVGSLGSVATSGTATSPKRGRGRPRKDRGVSGMKSVVEEDKENYHREEMGNVNGEVRRGSTGPVAESEAPTEMPTQMVVRGGRKGSVKRPLRGDGATVLTQNARYAVKLLPSTPRDLRRDGMVYRGCLGAAHHALAITRERAWIWDYTSHAPVNNARVFDVPFPVKKGEPLPFGALVAHGGSSEMGMVLIDATTGKVMFYDSIERAASLGLFQERSTGVGGGIQGLFSGETVTDLISADHAGFIITLSSGRIVQLTLRDAQGKARIFTQFLRATEKESGGIFGSIKGFLGANAWKRDVTAVHTRSLGTRGQLQVLSLTERAELQVWDLDWSGQCTFKSTIDFRELLVDAAKNTEPAEMHGSAENLTMLDFAIVEPTGSNSTEVATLGTEQPLELLVLLKAGGDGRCSYMLAEINIGGDTVRLGRLLDVMTYHRPSRNGRKPKMVLPNPQHTAIIAFDDALVVTSIGEQEGDSPEAQLRASYTPPLTFEDTVFVQKDKDFAVLGVNEEGTRGSKASCVAFVQGAGLIRLTAVDPENAEHMSRLPVKSKIEQAVFYGALQESNMVDFNRRGEIEYSADDIEAAALAVSDEILRSTSVFISTTPTSIEAHLSHKAQALRALVSHVRQNYPTLSKSAMWQLLWDAERVAAAQVLWTVFEGHVAAASKKKRTATVLDEVCATLVEQLHKDDDGAKDSDDAVRDFFVHQLAHLEKVFTRSKTVVKGMDANDQPSEVTLRLVLEANDIWNQALAAVFTFRADSAAAYGILPEFIEDGVLSDASEYAELSEFWTSTVNMLKSADEMCKLSRRRADDEWEKHANHPEKADLLHPIVQGILTENAGLVQLLCNIYQERIHWLASRSSAKDREMAEKLRGNYDAAREDEFRALAGVAQTEAGLRLAEKYRDMHTLTVLIVGEMQFCIDSLEGATADEREAIVARSNEMTERIGKYFERFGDDWANAYFDEGFSSSKAGMMLRDAQLHWQDALSRYLRADPSRARICWIDDVTASKDYDHARRCLLLSGREQEGKLWNKKVELSMAKLAMLATQEGLQKEGAAIAEHDFQRALPDPDLAVVEIQERLYRSIVPEILHCIDREAEIEVAMQKFVIKNQDLHALRSLLETCLAKILDHDALDAVDLIDVLTLIDSADAHDSFDPDAGLHGSEFYLALCVLDAAAPSLTQDRLECALQVLWKRCYVADAAVWNGINVDPSHRSTDDTQALLRPTALWRTLDLALEDGLFDAPTCAVRFLRPSECLGAGCRAEDLSWRFPGPDLLDPMLADMRTHDEQLRDLVASERVEEWAEACMEGAKGAVAERAEERAARGVVQREFEEGFVEGEEVRGNGVVNGVKSEAWFQDGDGDGSGDENGVEMSAEFDDAGDDGAGLLGRRAGKGVRPEREASSADDGEGGEDVEDEDGDVEMG